MKSLLCRHFFLQVCYVGILNNIGIPVSIGWFRVGNLAFGKAEKDPDGLLKLSRCVVIDDTMQWHVQVHLCTSHDKAG